MYHTRRVFFSQRFYKDLALLYAPHVIPAIRDAHVGSKESWPVEEGGVIILQLFKTQKRFLLINPITPPPPVE
jgi:hypothetical protein